MNKVLKKLISITIGVVIIGSMALIITYFGQLGKNSGAENVFPTEPIASLTALPEEDIKVLEDQKTELYLGIRGNCPVIRLVDKTTGEEWKSYETKEYYTELKSESQIRLISSLMTVYYTDFNDVDESVMTGVDGCETTYRVDENTLELLVDFTEEAIQIKVEISLKNGGIKARIPFDGIRENENHRIVSIELFPCFEMSRADEDGYVFIPDGSGVLLDFTEKKNVSLSYWNVYSPSSMDIDERQENADDGIFYASIPVYGMKKGDKAFCGIITEGDEEAQIVLAPSGYRLNMYRIYPSFTYRKRYTYHLTEDNEVYEIDKNLIKNDFEVIYLPLAGEEASYSGMAVEYRKYLEENDLINSVIKEEDDWAVGLDFIMSVNENQVLFNNLVKMTGFNEVEQTLTSMYDSGVKNLHTMIYGWQAQGYGINPLHGTVNSKIGGMSGLKKLTKLTEQYNFKAFMVDNYIDAIDGVGGFSSRKYAIHDNQKLVLTDDSEENFIVNPYDTFNFLKEGIKTFQDSAISGIAFEKLGTTLYSENYNNKSITKNETAQIWSDMLACSNEQFGYSAAEGANSYLFKEAYRLYNVPANSSQYFGYGREIPFLQMILHGNLYYSTDIGNFAYDIDSTKLKWIEYGSMPTFVLTSESADKLKYTELHLIFASDIEQWGTYAENLYSELNTRLQGMQSAKMLDHRYLNDDVVRITYDNGAKVYVNYGSQEIAIDAVTIKAMDYIVVTKEGDVR